MNGDLHILIHEYILPCYNILILTLNSSHLPDRNNQYVIIILEVEISHHGGVNQFGPDNSDYYNGLIVYLFLKCIRQGIVYII